MTSGDRIKAFRIERGLTQKQLGDMCGMADSAIRRYESNRGNPTEKTLQRIANALNVSVGLLTTGEDRKEIIPGRLWIVDKTEPGAADYQWTIEAMDQEAYNFGISLFDRAGISLLEYSPINRVIDAILKLNDVGQRKAVERVEELTEIPKYRLTVSQDAAGERPHNGEGNYTPAPETPSERKETPPQADAQDGEGE